jgi:CheY-like chemotaxis protein
MESGTSAASGPLVLVCDDSERIRRLIRINLELDDFVVAEATDGREAVTWLIDEANPVPAVITLDASMEPRDGWWAVAAIRANPRLAEIPCVMVTASVQVHDRVQAHESGFDAFISKPFDPVELVRVISHLARSGRGWYEPQ